VNGNVKLGRAAARSGEWAQHFSNASCYSLLRQMAAAKIKYKYTRYTESKLKHRPYTYTNVPDFVLNKIAFHLKKCCRNYSL